MTGDGHRRPAGTTTRIRLFNAEEEPPLGGLVFDDPWESKRGYRIVGVEEVARPGRWNLVLERMAWAEWFGEHLRRPSALAFGLVKRAA